MGGKRDAMTTKIDASSTHLVIYVIVRVSLHLWTALKIILFLPISKSGWDYERPHVSHDFNEIPTLSTKESLYELQVQAKPCLSLVVAPMAPCLPRGPLVLPSVGSFVRPSVRLALKIWITYIQAYMPYES